MFYSWALAATAGGFHFDCVGAGFAEFAFSAAVTATRSMESSVPLGTEPCASKRVDHRSLRSRLGLMQRSSVATKISHELSALDPVRRKNRCLPIPLNSRVLSQFPPPRPPASDRVRSPPALAALPFSQTLLAKSSGQFSLTTLSACRSRPENSRASAATNANVTHQT